MTGLFWTLAFLFDRDEPVARTVRRVSLLSLLVVAVLVAVSDSIERGNWMAQAGFATGVRP